MGLAVRLLRHLRRRHFFSPLSGASVSIPLQFSSVDHLPAIPSHNLFLGGISSRSFSWFSNSSKSGDNVVSPHRSSEILESDAEPDTLTLEATQMENGSQSELVTESSIWDYPVELVTVFLDGYHDLTGLPWWVIISSSTVAMRFSLLPILWLQLKKVSRIAELFPRLPPPFPPLFSGRSFFKQLSFFESRRKELECPSILWNFAFVAAQFPTFILWMSTIRNMCLSHHPGLETGGVLWFQNLTDTPHGVTGCIFPFMIAGLHYINIQLSFGSVKLDNTRGIFGLMLKYYKLYLDVISIPLFLIGFLIPQGSLVYWTTNGLFTLFQQLALRNEHVRVKLGLPDITSQRTKRTSSSENNAHLIEVSENNAHSLMEMDQEVIESLSHNQLLNISLEEMARGNLERALQFLKLVLEKDPDSARALVALSEIMFTKMSFQEAIEYVDRAIPKIQEEDPLLVLALYISGVTHNSLGNKATAINHLKRIPNLSVPEKMMDKACYYRGLVLLGSYLFEEGKFSEAIVYLRTAATYDPGVDRFVKECEEAMEQDKASSTEEAIEEDKKSVG